MSGYLSIMLSVITDVGIALLMSPPTLALPRKGGGDFKLTFLRKGRGFWAS
jgi:hypothetical protein